MQHKIKSFILFLKCKQGNFLFYPHCQRVNYLKKCFYRIFLELLFLQPKPNWGLQQRSQSCGPLCMWLCCRLSHAWKTNSVHIKTFSFIHLLFTEGGNNKRTSTWMHNNSHNSDYSTNVQPLMDRKVSDWNYLNIYFMSEIHYIWRSYTCPEIPTAVSLRCCREPNRWRFYDGFSATPEADLLLADPTLWRSAHLRKDNQNLWLKLAFQIFPNKLQNNPYTYTI